MPRHVEEIVLLLLDENRGDLLPVPARRLHCMLAGAALMDLVSEGRIDTDPERLMLMDSAPLNDDLLDPLLADIAQVDGAHSARFWVERFAGKADEIRDKTLSRLVAHGILEIGEGDFLSLAASVSHTRRYLLPDETMREDIRLRVMRALYSDEVPDPHDVEIICLAGAGGLFERLLSPAELRDVGGRLALLSRMDLIGRSISEAVRHLEPPADADRMLPPSRKEIPVAPRPPILNTLRGVYREYVLRQYGELGPIFQIKTGRGALPFIFGAPASHGAEADDRVTIMVGPEANQFFSKNDKRHLRSLEFWTTLAGQFDASRSILSMVGEEHFRLRRIKRPGYACAVGENLVPDIIDVVRSEIASWPLDEPIGATTMTKRLIYNLSGRIIMGMSIAEYFDDLSILLDRVLKHVIGVYPRRRLYKPRMQQARKRLDELATRIIAAHDPTRRGDRHPDIIDDLLTLHQTDPQFLPETDLKLAVLEPLWIPMDTTGHASSFLLYALLKRPDLLQRAKAEADALFAQGTPTAQGIHQLDIIHRTVLETLRLYPPMAATQRMVSNSFEFAGCTVPAGTRIVISFVTPHHMPAYFPDPGRFDIDRFVPPRDEHKQPWVYMPYGLGTHRCLGGHLAEFFMKAAMATILHDTELALDPPHFVLSDREINFLPTRHPKKSFRFRLVRRR